MAILPAALRSLRRTRAFSATAVLVLGLGLGANVILFNAVQALLWRPLPFPEPARLVSLQQRSMRGETYLNSSGRNATDLRERVSSIVAVGLAQNTGPVAVVLGADETADLDSAGVNSQYLATLGLTPVVGRLFGDEEDFGRTAEAHALLAESAWRRYFGADPGVVGRRVTCLDGGNAREVRIVGVYPDRATLPFLGQAALLTPIAWRHGDVASDRGNMLYRTVVRLKPGVSVEHAAAEAAAALKASEMELPEVQRGGAATLVPLRTALVASPAPAWLLYAAAGLLLVLTLVNLASLFLARALGRRHETAIRRALGASVWHTLLEQLAETFLVCAAGLAVALVLNEYASSLVPGFLPELRSIGPALLDTAWPLVAFGAGVACLAAGALAVLPALHSRRIGLTAVLAEGGRSATVRTRWQGVLASAQLAVILVLLTLGGLIGRSLVEALRTDPGFSASGAITLRAAIPGRAGARKAAAYDLARVLASVPGTGAVGFSAEPPLGEYYSCTHSIHPGPYAAADPSLAFRLVDDGWFRALGTRLVRGRTLTEDEVRSGRGAAVLNESGARLLFGGADPVGRQVRSAFGDEAFTVVGVVRDMRSAGLDRRAPAAIYRPYIPFGGSVVFTVRTPRTADEFLAIARGRARAWNAGVILRDAASLDADLRQTVASRMRASALVGGFALLGLLVGTVGLYGTIAGHVQRQQREVGIRMALGASEASIRRRVLGHAARLVVPGAVAGLALSAAGAAFVRTLLYGVRPWDAASFAIALLLLGGAALCASWLPAVRASRVSPTEALRQQ
jgi:predicted permease